MAKDPAFLFYPGDYLRDTQCLSEPVQVAYDRIMCEHMRNICISKAQLKFFTKKLNAHEVEELLMVLTEVKGGYQLDWVVDSINKRKAYSDSRRKNRVSNKDQSKEKICDTYDSHMENAIENENKNGSGFQENKKEFLTAIEIVHTKEFIHRTAQRILTDEEVSNFWSAFKIYSEGKAYHNRADKVQHFRNWLKSQKNETAKRIDTARPGAKLSAI